MLKRSFELFSVDLQTLNAFGALRTRDGSENAAGFGCTFTYEQSMTLLRSSKSNTQLFEQLTDMIGLPYTVSHNVSSDFLYECIFVDLMTRQEEDSALCLLKMAQAGEGVPAGSVSEVIPTSAPEAAEALYRNGFTITGVPVRDEETKKRPVKTAGCKTEDVHFRPFVASASMSRKGIYLFVNEAHLQKLMERLTLGFFSYDEKEHRITMPSGLFKKNYRVSPAKFSAYLGLMLSDGVSMREAQEIWKSSFPAEKEPPKLELNEESVFVAGDLEVPAAPLYERNGPCAWVFDRADGILNEMEPQNSVAEEQLIRFFRALGEPAGVSGAVGRAMAAGEQPLEAWLGAVNLWIAEVEEGRARLDWDGRLPPAPAKDEEFQKQLNHYAFLWGCALYRQLCGSPAPLWRPEDALDVRLEKCIRALETQESAQRTLQKLLKERDVLLSVQGASGEESADEGEAGADSAADGESVGQEAALRLKAGGACRVCFPETHNTQVYEAKLRHVSAMKGMKLNLFDGMGLCDDETFDILEKLLLTRAELQKKRRYSALIIRLPWLKGVLVRADFQAFFEEQGDVPEKIRDMFGFERTLNRIHIIVNESMLKGVKYLKNLASYPKQDPWKHYWDQVNAYSCSLLITGRNSEAGKVNHMNYQFLSTIGLNDEEMGRLVSGNISGLKGYLTDDKMKKSFFVHGSPVKKAEPADEDEGSTEEVKSENTDVIFGKAIEKNPQLMKARYAQSALHGHIESRVLDCMRGRLMVAADYRFVAPDLVCMLHYLADRYVFPARWPGAEKYQLTSRINQPQGAYHGHGFYYAPGENAPWLAGGKPGCDIAALRNPHYALGEGVIVSALPEAGEEDEYRRWFPHLDSCIMLPATATATMGGADFDGDRCLCVAEEDVVEALKRSCKRSVDSLHQVMEHTDAIKELIDKASKKELDKTYYQQLKGWLQSSLPQQPEANNWREGYCPPLIFGVSGNRSIDFATDEKNIDGLLYDAFRMTTEQQIGLLSIEALNCSGSTYLQPAKTTAQAEKTAKTASAPDGKQQTLPEAELLKLLRYWLFHWRIVSLALENGAEIDMAKTGVRCNPIPLRNVRADMEGKLADLERKHTSILRTFDQNIERNAELSRLSGSDYAKALCAALGEREGNERESLLERSEKLAQEEHNNVHLLPYYIHEAAFKAEKKRDGTEEKPLLPLTGASSQPLRTFLLDAEKKPAKETDGNAEKQPAVRTVEEAMGELAWAKNDERAETLLRYISDKLGIEMPAGELLADCPEMIADEQGVYFFKEVLKYMYHAAELSIDDGLSAATAKTPAALREELIGHVGKDGLLPFLMTCSSRHYDAHSRRYVSDMNDYLFLSLAQDSFVNACGGGKVSPDTAADPSKLEDARQAVRRFTLYRQKLAEQAGNAERMKARYAYCLRNLQRRFSLLSAYGIMNRYNRGLEDSRLKALGVRANELKKLYASLEDKK